jgi:hypothetical protein
VYHLAVIRNVYVIYIAYLSISELEPGCSWSICDTRCSLLPLRTTRNLCWSWLTLRGHTQTFQGHTYWDMHDENQNFCIATSKPVICFFLIFIFISSTSTLILNKLVMNFLFNLFQFKCVSMHVLFRLVVSWKVTKWLCRLYMPYLFYISLMKIIKYSVLTCHLNYLAIIWNLEYLIRVWEGIILLYWLVIAIFRIYLFSNDLVRGMLRRWCHMLDGVFWMTTCHIHDCPLCV